jgi:hypothetical protein
MRSKSKPSLWTRVFLITLNAALAWSNFLYASDFQSPRTAALGGAGHAAPLFNDSIYLNPSYTSFNPYRGLSANYLWHGSDNPNPSGNSPTSRANYNFSILDGSPDSLFQAGLGLTKRGDASLIHIGASKNVGSQLGFGLGTKIILPVGTNNRIFDGTLSVSGIATNWLQATLVVDNLFEANTSNGFYREFTLGTKLNVLSVFSVYFDPLWVPTIPSGQNLGYELGFELPILSDFYLRFGTFKNAMIPFEAARGDGFGLGLGWLGPKVSFDYGMSQVASPFVATTHQLGMTIFF